MGPQIRKAESAAKQIEEPSAKFVITVESFDSREAMTIMNMAMIREGRARCNPSTIFVYTKGTESFIIG